MTLINREKSARLFMIWKHVSAGGSIMDTNNNYQPEDKPTDESSKNSSLLTISDVLNGTDIFENDIDEDLAVHENLTEVDIDELIDGKSNL